MASVPADFQPNINIAKNLKRASTFPTSCRITVYGFPAGTLNDVVARFSGHDVVFLQQASAESDPPPLVAWDALFDHDHVTTHKHYRIANPAAASKFWYDEDVASGYPNQYDENDDDFIGTVLKGSSSDAGYYGGGGGGDYYHDVVGIKAVPTAPYPPPYAAYYPSPPGLDDIENDLKFKFYENVDDFGKIIKGDLDAAVAEMNKEATISTTSTRSSGDGGGGDPKFLFEKENNFDGGAGCVADFSGCFSLNLKFWVKKGKGTKIVSLT